MSWVIVGLGNPGEEYKDTRHNAGRMALDFYAKQAGLSSWKVDKKSQSLTTGGHVGKTLLAFVLPETFMNNSGAAVAKFVKGVKAAERLIVVYDDLDLPLGTLKVSFDRGSGGHNGVESIIKAVKTKKFVRIRIGICPWTIDGELRKPKGEAEVEKHILGKFRPNEMEELKRVFKKVADAIDLIVGGGYEQAMNRYN